MKYILRRWNIFSKGQITAQRDSSGKSKMTEQLTLLNDIISLLSHRQQKHLKLIWNKRERRNHCLHISEQQYWVGKQSAWDFQTTRWQSLHKQVELWGTPLHTTFSLLVGIYVFPRPCFLSVQGLSWACSQNNAIQLISIYRLIFPGDICQEYSLIFHKYLILEKNSSPGESTGAISSLLELRKCLWSQHHTYRFKTHPISQKKKVCYWKYFYLR